MCAVVALFGLMVAPHAGAEQAASVTGRYASIVVDADTLDIVHARQIDEARYPASLTKVMTLYLTFDALKSGQMTLDTQLPVSRYAAKTPPSKLGLKTGQTITVENAIKALAVKSANDVAVVLAEHLAGSEDAFAAQMTAKARSLGMAKTTFKNPHGLPHVGQTTTARDMAKLAAAVLNNHSDYYSYFGIETFRYNGRRYKNTNGLLHWLAGVDGFKTGYTRASGYNLIISAKREDRRIIAVVLGGASGKSRNQHMQDLVERSFDTLGVSPIISTAPNGFDDVDDNIKVARIIREDVPKKVAVKPAAVTTALRLRGRNSEMKTIVTQGAPLRLPSSQLDNRWSIQLGAFGSKQAALAQLDAVTLILPDGLSPQVLPVDAQGRTLYRARLSGLDFTQAHKNCRALAALKTGCVVIAPSG